MPCPAFNPPGYAIGRGIRQAAWFNPSGPEDAKWIFENCDAGTKVVIYDDTDPGPLGMPKNTLIPETGGNYPAQTGSEIPPDGLPVLISEGPLRPSLETGLIFKRNNGHGRAGSRYLRQGKMENKLRDYRRRQLHSLIFCYRQ